jgi:hypothetical protein
LPVDGQLTFSQDLRHVGYGCLFNTVSAADPPASPARARKIKLRTTDDCCGCKAIACWDRKPWGGPAAHGLLARSWCGIDEAIAVLHLNAAADTASV